MILFLKENILSRSTIGFIKDVIETEILKFFGSIFMWEIINFSKNEIYNFINIQLSIFRITEILFLEKSINQFIKII